MALNMSSAMDVHKYYGGSGAFSDRRKTWEDLGLGSAAEYQGTAVQNAQLVSAMNANKGLALASSGNQSATAPAPSAPAASNTAAVAPSPSSSTEQPTVANYASQSEQIAQQLAALRQQAEGYTGNPGAIYDDYLAGKEALGEFAYDPSADPTYQQYARQYEQSGRRAMEDTLAQVAARTGGLASSYAGTAAQQQYDRYMTDLDGVIPQLEQIAYSRYRDQASDIENEYKTRMQQDALAYERSMNDISGLENAYARAQSAEQQEYKYLADLIENGGYEPTDAELQRAGMSRERANGYKRIFTLSQEAAKAKSISGGSGSNKSSGSGSGTSSSQFTDLEKSLKKAADAIKGDIDDLAVQKQIGQAIKGVIDRVDYSDDLLDWTESTNYAGKSYADWYDLATTSTPEAAAVTLTDLEKFYKNSPAKFLEAFGVKRFREVYGSKADDYLKKLNK